MTDGRLADLAQRAMSAHQRGAFDEAIPHYEALVRAVDGAQRAAILYNLGAAYRGAGRLRDAEGAYRRALALAPDADAQNNLGLVYLDLGELPDAARAFESALALADEPGLWVNLGNARRAMGNRAGATDAYDRAIALDPAMAPAWFNLHAARYDERSPDRAIEALRRAAASRPQHPDTQFYLAALLRLHGRSGADELLMALPEACAFLRESLDFVVAHRDDDTRLFADTFRTLDHAVSLAPRDGLVLELGVRRGTSLRHLAHRFAPSTIHGFDAFEGLPEAWGDQPPGLYTTDGRLPAVADNAALVVGWFANTLPRFLEAHPGPLRFANVDCDLYSSAHDALTCLAPRVTAGTVLVFDEYLCNPGWQNEEHRALLELCDATGLSCRYAAFSLFTKQAVVVMV